MITNESVAGATSALAVTDETFDHEILQASGLAVVDFWATWCGPCRMIGPVVEQLAREYEGRAKIAKLDTDANPATQARFGVRSIPTLLFFKDGALVDRVVGAVPRAVLERKIEQHL